MYKHWLEVVSDTASNFLYNTSAFLQAKT